MSSKKQGSASGKTRSARKELGTEKRKKAHEGLEMKVGHDKLRENDISLKYKMTQQDIKNHIDADKRFARNLEETSVRVNRMMLRFHEKQLSEPSSGAQL